MQSKGGQSNAYQLKHTKATHNRPSGSNVHSAAHSNPNQFKNKTEHNIAVQSNSKQYKPKQPTAAQRCIRPQAYYGQLQHTQLSN